MGGERFGVSLVDGAIQDLRYALRACRRSPGFTLIALLTLAVGIGANTAVFSLVNAVLLRPLSYPDSSRMVWFLTTAPEGAYADASEVKFNAWRSIPSTFARVAAFRFSEMPLAAGDRFESVVAGEVTAEFFRLFGARTQVGRTFTADEGRPGAAAVVVIGDALWTRRFQRGSAIGQTLQLNRRSYVVVGILQPGFDTATLTSADFAAPDVWLPLQIDPASASSRSAVRSLPAGSSRRCRWRRRSRALPRRRAISVAGFLRMCGRVTGRRWNRCRRC